MSCSKDVQPNASSPLSISEEGTTGEGTRQPKRKPKAKAGAEPASSRRSAAKKARMKIQATAGSEADEKGASLFTHVFCACNCKVHIAYGLGVCY